MLSSDSLREKARPWLAFLDELQDLNIAHQQLPVPQIAVFGDQSSGKSSLLESISGIPFPKGTGLVTKCPTRITMSNTSASGSSSSGGVSTSWHAHITLPSHIDTSSHPDISRVVHQPSELSSLLAEASSLITAHSSIGFSKDTIHVHVQSPDTPDLTLIDLPGIIRTTTAGQDRSVIAEVDSLLSHFMSQEETVILAVIPANQDIATVDILERAHRHDPNGERTIGVLTKPDLIDQGAEDEVLVIAKNIRKPLKLGYVMVKNRNQAELKSALSLQDSMLAEEAYFKSHPIWNQLDAPSRGTRSLCDKLTNLIVRRAMDRAPYIKNNLSEKKKELEAQLLSLGQEVPLEDDVRRKMLVRLISRFTQTLRQVAQGDYRDALPQQHPTLRLKYTINTVLQQLEQDLKHKIPDLASEVYLLKLRKAMKDMRGR
jgi:interferon-induced GTP-binding protein Mx1